MPLPVPREGGVRLRTTTPGPSGYLTCTLVTWGMGIKESLPVTRTWSPVRGEVASRRFGACANSSLRFGSTLAFVRETPLPG